MLLVTNGAGYIGSHCVLTLLEKGLDIVVYDNLSTGHIKIIKTLQKYDNLIFVQGDLLNNSYFNNSFQTYNIESVIHFAAFSQVGESVKHPAKYYREGFDRLARFKVLFKRCKIFLFL